MHMPAEMSPQVLSAFGSPLLFKHVQNLAPLLQNVEMGS